MKKTITTHFAPAGRSTEQQLARERSTVEKDQVAQSLIDAMPDPALILNPNRQIVAVNSRLLEIFAVTSVDPFIGLRPGEAFTCIHHEEGPGGCGTSLNCSVCGAVMTMLECIETNRQVRGECRLTIRKDNGTALNLEIVATPLKLTNEPYYVCAIKDIGAEKWKAVMERTFFHDLINTAGGIRGLAAILVESEEHDMETEQNCKRWMLNLSDSLIDDIKHQRNLLAAEKGEYVPQSEKIDLAELVTELSELYIHNERALEREICMEGPSPLHIQTDPSILRRIVGNMLINALEATPRGDSITVRYRCHNATVRIEVDNPGEIPDQIQLQMFKRSFSTKSAHGRGIGTYSIKLFGERYLGGTVGFQSRNGRTVFFIELPQPEDCLDLAEKPLI